MKVSACGLSRTISFSSQQICAARKASSGYAQPSNPQAKTVFDRHDFQYLSGSALQFRPRSLASWVIRARSASPFRGKAEGPTLGGDASPDGRVPMELSGVLSRSQSRDLLLLRANGKPNQRGVTMLHWALTFLVIAIIAAIFGFGGIAATASSIAQILFVVFLALFLVSAIVAMARGRPPAV
jgi:uncharacterized membrane protein YtjA (UPF0391 family)